MIMRSFMIMRPLARRCQHSRCSFMGALLRPRTTASISSVAEESCDVPWPLPITSAKPRADAPPTLREQDLGFIGWGAMAQAVSLGILRKGLTEAGKIAVTDVVPQVLESAAKEGLRRSESNQKLVECSDIVVMAVKPQMVGPVIADIAPSWTKNKIMVSICAGITIETYQAALGADAKIVRVMPNTPCLVGEAATAYAGSSACEEWELDLVYGMFAAVGGATHRVPEYLLNTVTGLSGSGPAYIYMMIQALSDAGVHGGLPRNVSLSLAVQTVIGAAKMVQESGQHPAVLKEAVTSPAGTTIAGVRSLEKHNFNSAIIEAVETARARSEALSQKPDFLFKKQASS
eukprot:TRINITY_DN19769_c1_g1_i1.p1 TRINITY_DN19769_c1_g1~~TRINITY_DN19769_c1_g1_i1.p1  ORF type:complete len:346 (-),score=73.09 TRINITY_DN19769_c1_g1_i1:15-1052(-)